METTTFLQGLSIYLSIDLSFISIFLACTWMSMKQVAHTYVYVCICTYIYKYIYVYVCIYVEREREIHTYIYIYTHTHTFLYILIGRESPIGFIWCMCLNPIHLAIVYEYRQRRKQTVDSKNLRSLLCKVVITNNDTAWNPKPSNKTLQPKPWTLNPKP